MSWIKWSLALAGTALGMRYLSDRHRHRLSADSGATTPARPPLADESTNAWATPQGGAGIDHLTGGLSTPSVAGADATFGSTAPRL